MNPLKLRSAFLVPFIFVTGISVAQTVVTIPATPFDSDSVTVIYDAAKGNGALKNVSPPIYAHTGVITNLSASPTDWKYVIANWSQNTPKALMTPLGNNLYQIKMKPSIRAFYGVPQNETILKLAFVFRNADGSKVGREANGSDIYTDVYTSYLSVNIIQPAARSLYVLQYDSIPVQASSLLADTMAIYVNNVLVRKVAGQNITDTLPANNFGHNWTKQWVRITARNDTASKADSFYYSVLPAPVTNPLPQGMEDGINYIDSTKVILSLFAPYKKLCFLIGDFNNWQIDSNYYMFRTPDNNRYWFQLNNLVPRKEYIYQYLVDGTLRIADPFADKVSDPDDQYISPVTYPNLIPYPAGKTTEIASVFQTAQQQYTWNIPSFNPPKITDLVIYELLIRDFTAKHDYPSLIDTLNYLKRLGVNAIELMPIMEFEGNSSWGYNPDFGFAPDKYYGTKNGLKQFIDAAHAKGIAVILDIVLNHHFGKSPLVRLYWETNNNRPAENSPWFNPGPKHPYNVGYDFNHESPYTKSYSERILKYWISEYHVDGFRFDLSKGFTQVNSYPNNVGLWGQYDASRIAILDNYNNVMRSIKPNIITILEHFADNSEEKVLSGKGMLLWGNMNGKYNEATMGWNASGSSDFSWISYLQRGWAEPHVVGYMESHDEERLMYKNINYGNQTNLPYDPKDTTTALKRMEMAAAFFYTIPGPKMLWQFGELGYDYSINYPCGSDCRLSPKPIRWDYYNQWRRRYLFNTVAALTDLKKNNAAFETTDFNLSVSAPVKRINVNSNTMDVTIVGNFDVKEGKVIPAFHQPGTWYDYFSGDSITVVNTADELTLQPGEYHIYTSVKLQKPLFTGIDPDEIKNNTSLSAGLSTVYPNPSSAIFNIVFPVATPSHVRLAVYDLFGRKISTLIDDTFGIGTHQVSWNAKNGSLTPGFYFYRIEIGNKSETKKMMLE